MKLKDGITNIRKVEKFNSLAKVFHVVHGTRYDYSKLVYSGVKEPIIVICDIHGEFITSTDRHSRGSGCPKCAGVGRSNTSEFVTKAIKVHSNKYIYSKVEYTNNTTVVIITCPIHGDFKQSPAHHLRGYGCSKCSGKFVTNTKEFIELGMLLFKGKHTYEKSIFTKSLEPIVVTCKVHGDFITIPNTYQTAKYGCSSCAGSPKVTTETVIPRFIAVHGTKFNYSGVEYVNMHTNIVITCNTCRSCFNQTPRNHLNGDGCSRCNPKGGFDKTKPGLLYYLSINNGQAYKIGITNKTVQQRFSTSDLNKITVLQTWEYQDGKEAAAQELKILQDNKFAKYKGSHLLSSGNTELFSYDVLNLDIIGSILFL